MFKKLHRKIFGEWETVYSADCKCNAVSLFGQQYTKIPARAVIQVNEQKNKARGILKAMGQEQYVAIWEICRDNPEAQKICRKYNIDLD